MHDAGGSARSRMHDAGGSAHARMHAATCELSTLIRGIERRPAHARSGRVICTALRRSCIYTPHQCLPNVTKLRSQTSIRSVAIDVSSEEHLKPPALQGSSSVRIAMGAILLVAGLAVAATGCHGVDALQFDTGVPVDALRTVVSPVNEACDVESTHVALQKVSDELRDGCDTWLPQLPPPGAASTLVDCMTGETCQTGG